MQERKRCQLWWLKSKGTTEVPLSEVNRCGKSSLSGYFSVTSMKNPKYDFKKEGPSKFRFNLNSVCFSWQRLAVKVVLLVAGLLSYYIFKQVRRRICTPSTSIHQLWMLCAAGFVYFINLFITLMADIQRLSTPKWVLLYNVYNCTNCCCSFVWSFKCTFVD